MDARRAQSARAEMRCHYAYARARAFADSSACPLYVQGIEVRAGLDPRTIEIVAHDEDTVRLIRDRGREQAVLVRP